jgi:ABC-type dipeptide/oligopeptide/nickel transport system permease subunit
VPALGRERLSSDRSREVAISSLGVRPPTPSWGNILADGYAFIRNAPWLVIASGVPLILRDIFDPRLRRTF